ncbi:MAG: zinc ABC transporter substrate-binding protein [Patescibacteria group bacterium]|jgi:zinc transport system substrate-binding protein
MQKVQAFLIGGAVIACVAIGVVWRWRSLPSVPAVADSRLSVVATFYPLAEFAKQVGGEDIQLEQMVPDGVEPHEYEPTSKQIASASSADVFIMNGGGVDAWADDVAASVREHGGLVLKMTEVIETNLNDPHIWLDPSKAKAMVGELEGPFISRDGDHRDAYALRSKDYLTKLDMLDVSYSSGLAKCSLREIIVSHDAFGYLGARYTFIVHAILGLSPEAEPSVKAIADLTELAKRSHITTIFFETLVSPKLAQTLAGEVGARAEVLNPVEGLTAEERTAGKDYLDLMNDNLLALKTAMLCQ